MTGRRTLVAALSLCAAVPAAAQVVPRENTLHVSAAPGRERVIRTYASWSNRDCSPNPAPQVALGTRPGHGTVVVRPGTSTIREVREGVSQRCMGVSMPGTTVAYTAAPGFHGPDGFDYTVTSVNGTYHDTVVLDVR